MALAQMINRGPGRPPKTDVERAVEQPMGDGVPAAIERVNKALAAFELARSAAGHTVTFAPGALEMAKSKLRQAIARKEIADQLGEDDAPTEEDIEALQAKVDEIEDGLASVGERRAAFEAELDRRRALLSEAVQELKAAFAPWSGAVLDACDEQIADAVFRLGEAMKVVEQVERWRTHRIEAISVPKVTQEGRHRGPDTIDLPRNVKEVLEAWWRGYRQLLRH